MKKRSLERFYESDKSHCISLLHPSPLPSPLLAHWKLSSRPITGRLFYSNEARVMALVSPLPPVEWSQCRKSHDHRWKITRNPVCWNLTVITVSLCGRRTRFEEVGSLFSNNQNRLSSYLSSNTLLEIVLNNIVRY